MLTLADLLDALAPSLTVGGAERVPIANVCIDSRQARAGSLFVALRGERTDGHAYVTNAFDAGATVALVEPHAPILDTPVPEVAIIDTLRRVVPSSVTAPVAIVVADALQALQHVARARRLGKAGPTNPDLRVVGVTGSVGKTTAKEAIASVLSQRYVTLKNAGNQNNEVGLPLTLMALEPEHERAVLEMGMYALGEIALLCDVARPQVGVVTNVGPSHLERLGSIERIAQAKSELVEALPPDGVAILNGDDPFVRNMSAKTKARVVPFGLADTNDLWADAITGYGLDGTTFVAHVAQSTDLGVRPSSRTLELATLGHHAVLSALAAVAVGLVEGLDWEEIQQGLLAQGYGLRLIPKRGIRGTTLLDDSYNASPASTLAALDLLAELPGRQLAALGDMLELGTYETEGHRQVGRRCGHVLDFLVTVGRRAQLVAEGALEAGLPASSVHSVSDNVEAIEILSERLQEGDVLLIKGSRSMAMETIVNALLEEQE